MGIRSAQPQTTEHKGPGRTKSKGTEEGATTPRMGIASLASRSAALANQAIAVDGLRTLAASLVQCSATSSHTQPSTQQLLEISNQRNCKTVALCCSFSLAHLGTATP